MPANQAYNLSQRENNESTFATRHNNYWLSSEYLALTLLMLDIIRLQTENNTSSVHDIQLQRFLLESCNKIINVITY